MNDLLWKRCKVTVWCGIGNSQYQRWHWHILRQIFLDTLFMDYIGIYLCGARNFRNDTVHYFNDSSPVQQTETPRGKIHHKRHVHHWTIDDDLQRVSEN